MKRLRFEYFIAPYTTALIPSFYIINHYPVLRFEIGFLKFFLHINYYKNK